MTKEDWKFVAKECCREPNFWVFTGIVMLAIYFAINAVIGPSS